MEDTFNCHARHPKTPDNTTAAGRCKACQLAAARRYAAAERQRVRADRAELVYRREAFQVISEALTAAMSTRSETSRGQVLARLADLMDALSADEVDRSKCGRLFVELFAVVTEAKTAGADK